VRVERTGDGVTRRPPVLKTGRITGPHALPCSIHHTFTDQNFEKENPKQIRVHPQESVADSFLPATSAEGRCANMAWVTSSRRDIVSALHR
jgi:hypothetical protein